MRWDAQTQSLLRLNNCSGPLKFSSWGAQDAFFQNQVRTLLSSYVVFSRNVTPIIEPQSDVRDFLNSYALMVFIEVAVYVMAAMLRNKTRDRWPCRRSNQCFKNRSLFSCKIFLCFNTPIWPLVTWANTLFNIESLAPLVLPLKTLVLLFNVLFVELHAKNWFMDMGRLQTGSYTRIRWGRNCKFCQQWRMGLDRVQSST